MSMKVRSVVALASFTVLIAACHRGVSVGSPASG